MKPTAKLHELGQSLWLDNITRPMLRDGVLRGYVEELSVTGLTSNPTIFDKAISGGSAYDEQIAELSARLDSSEEIFFQLAMTDLREAADLFADVHQRTAGVDGFVSLEVSPKLADDADGTIEQATRLYNEAERDNLFIKIPGTRAGQKAIEEAIFAGVPVNVTLLFDDAHYLGAADAYMSGIERRIEAGLDPVVASVASVFISRWDVAVAEEVDAEMRNRLGIAVAGRVYRTYLETVSSHRMQTLMNAGARPQRLLWASTGTKDPDAPDTLYIDALVSPLTVNTMPEPTLNAFADHGAPENTMPREGEGDRMPLQDFVDAGIKLDALATRLQDEGKEAFVDSWNELLKSIDTQRQGA